MFLVKLWQSLFLFTFRWSLITCNTAQGTTTCQLFCQLFPHSRFCAVWRCECIWVSSSCRSGRFYLRHNIDLGGGDIRIGTDCTLSNILKLLIGYEQVSIYFVTDCLKIKKIGHMEQSVFGFSVDCVEVFGIMEDSIVLFFLILVLKQQGKRRSHQT